MVDSTSAASLPLPGNRYRVREVLGSGGKSTVYLADDALLSRQVAVKVFRARAETPQALDEQEHEAKLIASLNHHALTTLFDAGVDTTDPARPQIYLVMEYIPGSDLKERLRSGPIDAFQLCWLGRDLAEGLAYLHESGFLHRDIKPANVLLAAREADTRLRGKLADFGIASLVGRDDDDEFVTGTAAYLSPEQVEGRRPTPESDVDALGLVLLEALTGRVAYPGSLEESAFARLDRDPEIPASIPAPIRDLLKAMTALRPARRPTLLHVIRTFNDLVVDGLIERRTALPVPVPNSSEAARLAALTAYDILDTPDEAAFDQVTHLAARFLKAPIALISIIDADRVWVKSRQGIDTVQIDRNLAFCSITNPGTGPWSIPDTHLDPRTATNPTVTGEPFIRAYAAAPLITRDGHLLGALCACDNTPREFDSADLETLVELAQLVMHELDIRLAARRAILN